MFCINICIVFICMVMLYIWRLLHDGSTLASQDSVKVKYVIEKLKAAFPKAKFTIEQLREG